MNRELLESKSRLIDQTFLFVEPFDRGPISDQFYEEFPVPTLVEPFSAFCNLYTSVSRDRLRRYVWHTRMTFDGCFTFVG